MAKYKFCFEEILQRIVEIEAESEDKADEIAHKMYHDQEIILDDNDVVERNIFYEG